MRIVVKLVAAALFLALVPASAQADELSGNNELTGMVGGQIGIHAAPDGGKLYTEYGHRLSELGWLDLQLNLGFGGGRVCFVDRFGNVDCSGYGARALDLIAGGKWKFVSRNEKTVPYLKAGGGMAFLFYPGTGNDAFAPIVRGGGGLKYYVAPSLAVGGESNLTLGPGFYGCGRSCTTGDLYMAWDLAGGVEFNF